MSFKNSKESNIININAKGKKDVSIDKHHKKTMALLKALLDRKAGTKDS